MLLSVFVLLVLNFIFLYVEFLLPLLSVGNGLDVDEYVRRAYKYAYSDCIEVGPVACLPEPPDPNELYPRQSRRLVLLDLVIIFIYDMVFN